MQNNRTSVYVMWLVMILNMALSVASQSVTNTTLMPGTPGPEAHASDWSFDLTRAILALGTFIGVMTTVLFFCLPYIRDQKNKNTEDMLSYAKSGCWEEMIRSIRKKNIGNCFRSGYNVDFLLSDEDGYTIFHHAASLDKVEEFYKAINHLKISKEVISKGEVANVKKGTPLMLAIQKKNIRSLENYFGANNTTALKCDSELEMIILESAACDDSSTIFHLMASYLTDFDSVEILKKVFKLVSKDLSKFKSILNRVNNECETFLHTALKNNNHQLLRVLMDQNSFMEVCYAEIKKSEIGYELKDIKNNDPISFLFPNKTVEECQDTIKNHIQANQDKYDLRDSNKHNISQPINLHELNNQYAPERLLFIWSRDDHNKLKLMVWNNRILNRNSDSNRRIDLFFYRSSDDECEYKQLLFSGCESKQYYHPDHISNYPVGTPITYNNLINRENRNGKSVPELIIGSENISPDLFGDMLKYGFFPDTIQVRNLCSATAKQSGEDSSGEPIHCFSSVGYFHNPDGYLEQKQSMLRSHLSGFSLPEQATEEKNNQSSSTSIYTSISHV